MGKGRKPKPTALKILHGEKNKDRINFDEPKPPIIKNFHPPPFLDEDAGAEWDRVASILERLGLLTEIDVMALAAYCQSYSQWLKAMELIKKDGLVIISEKTGVLMHNPAVSISNKSMEIMHKFMSEFGMTPSSRTRISVSSQDNKDDEMKRLCS